MNKLHEVLVEKQPGLDTGSKALTKDLEEQGLVTTDVRVINRYIISNLTDEDFKDSVYKVFAEKNADRIYSTLEEAVADSDYLVTELLPGQFDMRANAAEECLQLIYANFDAEVKFQSIIMFAEKLKKEQREAIRKAMINPVEMREGNIEVSFAKAEPTGDMPLVYDGFIDLTANGLRLFYEDQSLAMSLADLVCIQDYFKEEGRNPNQTELKVLDTYWSDHCRHTTFQTDLESVEFETGTETERKAWNDYLALRKELGREHKPVTLMDLATIGAKALKKSGDLDDLDESEEINACSIIREIRTDKGIEPYIIQFKNETHNHPTEIEPFGGAATCLGGAIRDPLAGRAYVYQAMRITGAMDPTQKPEDTLPGKLPQRTISTQAAKGYSSYGNQIGLAAGVVHEIYHPGYAAKRMEVGAVIGSAPVASVDRRIPEAGDLVLLVGGRTGRDGVGGATGSSKSHDVTSMETSGSEVQKGNAPTERKLQRLIRNDNARRLIKRCNDFGAGGVSVAVGELADGLTIDLDLVPLKYQGLTATETAVSESQERMAMVLSPDSLEEFKQYLDEENLEATVIAAVTDTNRLIMKWRGQEAVNLKRSFLDSAGAKASQSVMIEASEPAPVKENKAASEELILNALLDLNNQSQKSLHEMFDSTNGCATVTLPYGGNSQETEASHMAALIPAGDGVSKDATIMTYGFDPYLSENNQYKGAYFAVAESLAKMAAAGAGIENTRLSFQEYFQKLGQVPENWGKPVKSLLGALDAQLAFKTASIGGKDSMSGSFGDISVPPTLISFAVNTMPGELVLSNALKGNGTLYFIKNKRNGELPDAEDLLRISAFIKQANEKGLISACDTAARGLAMTLFNMSWGNKTGFEAELSGDILEKLPQDFILEIAPEKEEALKALAESENVVLTRIGITAKHQDITINGLHFTVSQTLEAASQRLNPVFRRNVSKGEPVPSYSFTKAPMILPKGFQTEKPRALITVFPGSNCEYDLARAFNKAGAQSKIYVFKNRDQADLKQSILELSQEIAKSQIIMIPGGFSAGDEPDGSGKYIANVFRNSTVAGSVTDLLDQRKGLVIGICNGFQALVRLGLLPDGRITEPREDLPLLAVNSIGRHMDTIARVRVSSNASPWLTHVKPGEVYSVPISHGEGRFMASSEVLNTLAANGQIITQYCDPQGNATMDAPFNPNGSLLAIEGIVSPDGRVLGKMGHNERWQDGLFRNYTGQFDMKLFQAGVEYFTK